MSVPHRTENGERGAVLVHVAFGLLALMAFSTFVIDYGVFWLGRRQAQNAADAGALAGAIALGYDDFENRDSTGPAQESAQAAAHANLVFGEVPSVELDMDITFPSVPSPECDGDPSPCVRVDVYRTAERNNPLPMFFGLFIGMPQQDVRATATARVSTANATDCLKPWGVIDKWQENQDEDGWTTESVFDKYDNHGELDPSVTNPDVYTPPSEDGTPNGNPGTGFYPFEDDGSLSPWYGLQLPLKVGGKQDFQYASGWFAALALTDSKGGKDYRNNIKGCVGVTYKIGDEVPVETEPGQMVGPTMHGVENDADSLVNQDPTAYWDTDLNKVMGSAYGVSPRIVAIPLVNPDVMADAKKNGRASVPISNILGFFVEEYDNSEKAVLGRLVTVPGFSVGNAPAGSGSFLKSIALIR